ncbi:MAG: ion channel [Alphaproteobacteria bacterium]|nr:ion channel [Alphaproteobacteria bacterium]
MHQLRERIRVLYTADTPTAESFRVGLMAFDITAILFFIVVSFLPDTTTILAIDFALGLFFLVEFLARFWISRRKWRFVFHFGSLADLIVIFSLLLAPFVSENFAFLRVLRALRLLRSHRAIEELRQKYAYFARNEEMLHSMVNLIVFIFVCTAVVYVLQVKQNPAINSYVDALYFTVATLTTTGFGDITLVGDYGHFLAVLIMIFGISLFVRLAQTMFRPAKVRYECPACGLVRHDPDAVHCKHCGEVLHIETEGI